MQAVRSKKRGKEAQIPTEFETSLECGDSSPLWSHLGQANASSDLRAEVTSRTASLCWDQSGDKSPHSKETSKTPKCAAYAVNFA